MNLCKLLNKWAEGEALPYNNKNKPTKNQKTNNNIRGIIKLETDHLANVVIVTDSIKNHHQMLKPVG